MDGCNAPLRADNATNLCKAHRFRKSWADPSKPVRKYETKHSNPTLYVPNPTPGVAEPTITTRNQPGPRKALQTSSTPASHLTTAKRSLKTDRLMVINELLKQLAEMKVQREKLDLQITHMDRTIVYLRGL